PPPRAKRKPWGARWVGAPSRFGVRCAAPLWIFSLFPDANQSNHPKRCCTPHSKSGSAEEAVDEFKRGRCRNHRGCPDAGPGSRLDLETPLRQVDEHAFGGHVSVLAVSVALERNMAFQDKPFLLADARDAVRRRREG